MPTGCWLALHSASGSVAGRSRRSLDSTMNSANRLAPSPKWLVRTNWVMLALAAMLLLAEVVLVQSRGRGDYAKIVVFSTLGLSAAIAFLGLIGLAVTSLFRWLWLVLVGGIVAVISILLVVAKFNFGM